MEALNLSVGFPGQERTEHWTTASASEHIQWVAEMQSTWSTMSSSVHFGKMDIRFLEMRSSLVQRCESTPGVRVKNGGEGGA